MNWRWAVRDLWRHRSRALLSVAGVAVASALLLDMVMLSGGLERSLEKLLLSRGYQLRVTPKGTLPFDTEATLGDAANTVAVLRADLDVAQAGAMLATAAFARRRDSLRSIIAYGVDPTAQGFYVVSEGTDLEPGDSSGVLLGPASARLIGATIGDTVTIVGRLDPQVATTGTSRAFVVRGIARFLYDARDQPSLAMLLPRVQDIAGPTARDRASFMMVRVHDDADPAAVAARLRTVLPNVGVSSIGDMVAQFRVRLAYFRQMSFILGTIALVVTVLLVGTLLAITVNEQIGDIAALRAIGVARSSILRRVLVQGVALTISGGAIGIVLGLATARWLDTILRSFPGLPTSISFFVADRRPLAIAALTLGAAGTLAGLPAAWRAMRAPIAGTLRSEAP